MNKLNPYALYLVTDPELAGPRGVPATVEQALAGGVTTVQVRAKHLDGGEFLAQVLQVAEIAAQFGAQVIVNDRVDVFLSARNSLRGSNIKVHGVHVGQSDLPVAAVRELIGPEAQLGLSATTLAHVQAANKMQANPATRIDLLGVGPYRTTATKQDAGSGIGTAGIAELVAATEIPCVAIGGIKVADFKPLAATGIVGVAVVSALMAAPDPTQAAADFIQAR